MFSLVCFTFRFCFGNLRGTSLVAVVLLMIYSSCFLLACPHCKAFSFLWLLALGPGPCVSCLFSLWLSGGHLGDAFCLVTLLFGAENDLKTCNYVSPVVSLHVFQYLTLFCCLQYILSNISSFGWLLKFWSIRLPTCILPGQLVELRKGVVLKSQLKLAGFVFLFFLERQANAVLCLGLQPGIVSTAELSWIVHFQGPCLIFSVGLSTRHKVRVTTLWMRFDSTDSVSRTESLHPVSNFCNNRVYFLVH